MIKIVMTNNGIIIGEKIQSDNTDILCLKNPRQLMMTTKDGITQFGIGELPWKPAVFECSRGMENFDVHEEAILGAYKQSVTGLVLPKPGISLVQ